MGGAALLIHGELDPTRRAPPPQRGFLARLFGKPGMKVFELGDRTIYEIPPGALRGLERGFREFLDRAMPEPWPATKAMLDYLGIGVTTVYLRGEGARDAEPEFTVQVSFSGCAGQAQVSADLAAHWAQLWFARERDRIDAQWLRPAGFAASRTEAVAEGERFLPVGDAGYAEFSPEPVDVGGTLPVHFAVDVALEETSASDTEQLMSLLESRFVDLMRDGRCRCQLCAPEFDLAAIADLPRFD